MHDYLQSLRAGSQLKGVRFVKLKWTQFTKPEFVERMYLLVGIALLLWTSVGRAGEDQAPKVRLEQDEGGAAVTGAHRFLLLAEDDAATQADDKFCPRASATATPQRGLSISAARLSDRCGEY